MQIIYESNLGTWVKYKQLKGAILASVGTLEEMKIPELGGKYQWSVGLVNGENHPLWGQNFGTADTLDEAKQRAEQFINDNF